MASRASVWAVVPAYNEAETIGGLVGHVQRHGYRVICVDDCSSDRTASIARSQGCHVVNHPINLGQGAAIQTGIDHALTQGADIVCTLDADGQHDPDDLPRLIEALARQGADFALGSRFLGSAVDIPAERRALLLLAVAFTRLMTRLPVTDTHNGIRAMTRKGAMSIQLRQDRMAHASEILAQIRRSGLPMVEVPVTVTYSPYSLGKGQRSISALRVLADLVAGVGRR